jgi:hypothetical protein
MPDFRVVCEGFCKAASAEPKPSLGAAPAINQIKP